MINRAVLIVRPRQPFLDWAATLDDSGLLPDVEGEQTVYLVPSFETDNEEREVLEAVFCGVFENELWGWHTDDSDWPDKRDLKTFEEWFSVEMHSIVEDLCDYPLCEEDE